MRSLKSALGFSALESIGSRAFDLAIIWVVLNSLPAADIAKFGLATASIFIFNFIFFAPETALLRNQKKWADTGELKSYLSAFISFSTLKLILHIVLAFSAHQFLTDAHWLVYSIIFSAITQQIQMAEIARIYMRMELQQRHVAKFELLSKAALFTACLWLFEYGSLRTYFGIYFGWSLIIAGIWLYQLNSSLALEPIGAKAAAVLIWNASTGFSVWSHFSGVLTFYIYNANVLYLDLFNAPLEDIALYTVVSKVANLFFVIPMFFQSFVAVILANAGKQSERKFKEILFSNGILSLAQFLFFIALGWWLAPLFGLKDPSLHKDFYSLGLIINGGILALNVTRPLSAYLLLTTPPNKVMLHIFMPSAVVATVLFTLGSLYGGTLGCAIGSAVAYVFMALMLVTKYVKYKRTSSINLGVSS